MTAKILLGSGAFWASLKTDIEGAADKVWVQAMTFEGDAAGEGLYQALIECPAADKKLCVDNFSNVVISDEFIRGPHRLRSAQFRAEIKNTRRIHADLRARGIGLFFTNPMGFLLHKYPHRNHKKLMLIDDHITYIGGINFSDHNFAWHDMMVRIEDAKFAKVFEEDFSKTIAGQNQSVRLQSGVNDIFILDGYRSRALYEDLFEIIRGAKRSITVISPYITWPFVDVIGAQAERGIDVKIVSPEANNKALLKYDLQYQQSRYPFSIWMYTKAMSHLKALLIDDEILIFGSTNFDFASYFLEQEYCLVMRDQDLVRAFKRDVVDDAMGDAVLYEPSGISWRHKASARVIKLAIALCKRLAGHIYKD